MNEIIFDADILSMLGKIGRIDLLRELFLDSELFITFEVYNELLAAKEIGYDFIDPILEQNVGIMHLDPDFFTKNRVKTALRVGIDYILFHTIKSPFRRAVIDFNV